jgi:hypothetical protein
VDSARTALRDLQTSGAPALVAVLAGSREAVSA